MKLSLMIILFIGIVVMSCRAAATDYLVWQFTEGVRVVLKQTPGTCKNGNQAVAQRIDSKYIPGCWAYEANPELIKIIWHNGDFAVLKIKDFTLVQE